MQLYDIFRSLRRCAPTLLALGVATLSVPSAALAQAIALTVNGEPITTTEVDEQMRFLRIVKQPASRDQAIEDLIADHLKLRQANKVGIDASDASLNAAFLGAANKAKTTTSALLAEFQRAKLNTDLIRSHFRAIGSWNDYVKSRNKSLAVSEEDVTAAMAKDSNLGKSETDYQLQQIVFVLPIGATPAVVEQRTREAQTLRNRFQGCAQGLPMARALPDVAVKPPITKKSTTLPENTRKELEQTGNGRLTPPARTATGIEMVAVCSADEDIDHTSIRDSVANQLLTDRLAKVGEQLYKDLRANAVIERR
jgi:peptidyl-prolyl cis-trans isomerase SurA